MTRRRRLIFDTTDHFSTRGAWNRCAAKNPCENHADRAGDVFLVIDVQNDFCPRPSSVPYGDDVVSPINRLANRFTHIVLTQDGIRTGITPSPHRTRAASPMKQSKRIMGRRLFGRTHCIQETHGAQLHADLQIPHAELILRKGFRPEIDSYSAFFEMTRDTDRACRLSP